MQYQVFKEDTKELVAWIDTSTKEQVLMKGYSVKAGDNLYVTETDDCDPLIPVGKFEKVSWEQWCVAREYPDTGLEYSEYDSIRLPKRATKGSAGYDFFLPYDVDLEQGVSVKIPTGIKCKIDNGYVLQEYPRSSLGFKYRVQLDNTVGIIDSDYYNNPSNEGHIFIKMTNNGDKPVHLNKGEAFCQGIFIQFFITEDDCTEAERVGGIGSTSK